MNAIIESIGKSFLSSMNHILNLFAFTTRLLGLLAERPVEGRVLIGRTVVEQIYFTAVQALYIIIPLSLMIGSMLIIQITKLSGEFDIGKLAVILIVREVGPLFTALLVILRSATAVTIEISYMNVFNEIEAIEMAGADPIRLICYSRFIGITSAVLCLFIVFDIVAIFGGNTLVWMLTNDPVSGFLNQVGRAITGTDLIVGLLKAVFFGITITVISLYHGFAMQKKVTMIPVSASLSAVECFFSCMVINIFISGVFYL